MSNTNNGTNIDRLKESIRKSSFVDENACPTITSGVISRIDDPDNLGRVKVILDLIPDYVTGWTDTLSFNLSGKLPKILIDRRILIMSVNNSFEDLRVDLGVAKLIYQQGESLPPANKANLGVNIIRLVNDSNSVEAICQLRHGSYFWEPTCAISHLHAPGDTLFQGQDTGGDFQQTIPAQLGSDTVFLTTDRKYVKESKNLRPSY